MNKKKAPAGKARKRKGGVREAGSAKADPWAEREARKYERPIKSREYIMEYLAAIDRLLSLDELAEALGIEDEAGREALSRRLGAMVRDGQLVRNRRGAYGLPGKMDLVRGRVVGHPDGFGFLVPDDGGQDLYLSPREMRQVLHGDRVLARVVGVDRRGRREGAIVEVLESNTRELVGRYFEEGGVGFVTPSNKNVSQDIVIPPGEAGKARSGQIVVVEIVQQPSRHARPVGRVVEVLGDHMAPGMEVEIAIRSHDLPHQWPAAVQDQIKDFPTEVAEADKAGREDLRELPLVTIDGEDAKDFDDAVYCERHGRGWRLIVAIADVSAYVAPGSALDEEAVQRGNSVYFPQQVIPMLPEILSNHLCSLRPEVDRLCLACELFITPAGRIREFRFFDGVMRSHARLTYDQVAAMLLEGDEELAARHEALLPHLRELYRLYQALRRAREKRGAIDFDRMETRIVFGERRKIERIVPLERNDAHRMIEEFMISANIAAARFLEDSEIPSLFRIHPEPGVDKINELRAFLAEMGLSLGGGDKPTAKDFAALLASLRDRPDRHLVETVMLRSLSQAMYSAENIGHFGLALESYTHFTSPIRRYPDLIIHRAIRHLLKGGRPRNFLYSHSDMERLGDHCSMTERRADEATRDAVSWLKCEYMMDKVGQVFDGIVTAVTSFGLFVELEEVYVEGLVHVTALENDYYHYDPVKHMLYGERSGRTYRLADPIRVRVTRVDLDERKIDFVPADGKPAARGKTARGARRGRGPARKKGARSRR
ncbi:MAG TPA: ribonuclease R [Gammaproteobacteria bacterium]|nr:ribonuclease R [Gammaproteobacteria bacterium]